MSIPIPFALAAQSVPRVVDYMDILAAEGTTIDCYATDFDPADVVQSMHFAAKRNLADSDFAVTTLLKTITTTPSVDGVLSQLADLTTWLGQIQFDFEEAALMTAAVYTYAIEAVVQRGTKTYRRVIQTGTIFGQQTAITAGAFFDGVYEADGTLFADGFVP